MEDKKTEITRKSALEIIKGQVANYRVADRSTRGMILDALESNLNRPRKSLIRTLNRFIKQEVCYENAKKRKLVRAHSKTKRNISQTTRSLKRRGRPRKYTKDVESALMDIWETYNYICAERLYPQIPIAIKILKRDKMWHYSDATTQLLQSMPMGTLKAYLVRYAKDKGLMRGISTTRTSDILDQVPIFHGNWKQKPLGFAQIDTVVHSGPDLIGEMVYTVSLIEMQTYWQEFYAQLGKSAEVTKHSVSKVIQHVPFIMRGIHSDTGSEFINSALINWCKHKHIEFTRSRPYEKNDNCNVEERNRSIVRHYVGFERYDCMEAVNALNELYAILRLYVNYFLPIMKIKHKTRYPNGKVYRKYDSAKTPYERVMEHPDATPAIKAKLTTEYETLNPKALLDKIKALTINLERLQKAQGYHFTNEN